MGVTIRQLRAFVSVAHEGSFVRAAARLHVSPSAVTIAIRDFEAEVGLRLFDRSTRSVVVTRQASSLLLVVERALDDLEHAFDDLHSLTERKKGSVVVASSAGFINYVLAPSVARLSEIHPGVSVRTIEDTTDSVVQKVAAAEVDFGITTLWRSIDKVGSVALLRDRFGVIASEAHPLSKADTPIDWLGVADMPLASMAPAAGVRAQLEEHPKLKRMLPRPLYEASNLAALQALVACGAAVATVPWTATRLPDGHAMKFRPLQNPVIWRELFLVFHVQRTMPPAASDLIALLLATMHQLGQSEHLRLDAQPGVMMRLPGLRARRG